MCFVAGEKEERGKKTEGIEWLHQETVSTLREKENKYLGIFVSETIKQTKLEEKIRKKYFK